jgi:outer membrane phospholipase A
MDAARSDGEITAVHGSRLSPGRRAEKGAGMKELFVIPLALLAATPALALDPPTVAEVHATADGSAEAVLVFTNGGSTAEPPPARLSATVTHGGVATPVTLQEAIGGVDAVPAGGFARLRYHFQAPAHASGDLLLSLDAAGGYRFAETQAPGEQVAAATTVPAAVPGQLGVTPPPPRPNNPLLGNLSTYNPIYAVLGHGTDTDAKLELSFKYQLLGHPGDGHWYSGFHFAYTQRMFWDLGANSAPFRDVNYQPEFLYIYTLPKNEAGDQLNIRGGFLHESNGRDGSASRSYNILYVQPTLDVPIGRWTASIGPRIYHYVINRDGNEDIARYRGHQALAFSIGQDQGLKLSTWSRLNFSTGKGSVDADLSYPLTGLWHDIPLYVVVQGFTGYGEDLLDYNRKQTRLRVGIGIVR